jgi:sugar lactone lactonase YvrE
MLRRMTTPCAALAIAVAVASAGCGKKDEDEGAKGKKPDEATAGPGADETEPPDRGGPGKAAEPGKIAVTDVGFMTPESVLHDAENDVYLVSNINGSALEEDDNGFISKVSPEGKVLDLKWIDGASDEVTLNAPKGLAIAAGVLYVADITAVRLFDLATGAPKGEIAIEGATFVNDLFAARRPAAKKSAGAGASASAVYVTDSGLDKKFEPTGADAVYKIVGDKAEEVLKDKALGGPNGVFVDKEGIWVVTFRSGEMFVIAGGKKADSLKLPKGGLDGIARLSDGKFLISSWEGSCVFAGPAAGPFEPLVSGVDAPADIGYDSKRNRLLIPLFKQNALEIHSL